MHKLDPALNAAFIFPNGKVLQASIVGHEKTARNFIRENENFSKRFNLLLDTPKSKIYTEEDFLIIELGAIKLATYGVVGKKLYYNSKKSNKVIVEYYVKRGFSAFDLSGSFLLQQQDISSSEVDFIKPGYNQTIIIRHIDGKEQLMYNPERIGD